MSGEPHHPCGDGMNQRREWGGGWLTWVTLGPAREAAAVALACAALRGQPGGSIGTCGWERAARCVERGAVAGGG